MVQENHFSAPLQTFGGNTGDEKDNDNDEEPEDNETLKWKSFFHEQKAKRNNNNGAENVNV